MFRLTFTLAAALYAGFVVWGDPETATAQSRTMPTPILEASAGVVEDVDAPTIIGSAREAAPVVTRAAIAPVTPDAAAIAAAAPIPTTLEPRLIGEPIVVSLMSPAGPASVDDVASTEGLLRVTGSRVNMRSGPGVSNGVVDSLPLGTLAEPIGAPIDGWQEIRDVESGLTGFMSARFLEPS